MNEWIQLGWLFVAVSGIGFVLLRRLLGSRPPVETEEPAPPVFGALTPSLAGAVPMTREGATTLSDELRAAGLYRRTALMEYAAIRAVLVLLPLIATAVAAYYLPTERLNWVLGIGLGAVVLGFSLPRVHLSWRIRTRSRQIERGLPVAMDLMTLCLTAGQTLLAAIDQAARETKQPFPALSEELAITEQQARLHSLETALEQWAARVRVPEVKNLALLLQQSERLGTDTASTLLEYANSMRTTLRQHAEARAGRASFWMLFPSVLCLWVAAAIVLIGPTYLEFWRYRRDSLRLLQSGQNSVRQTTPSPTELPAGAAGSTGSVTATP